MSDIVDRLHREYEAMLRLCPVGYLSKPTWQQWLNAQGIASRTLNDPTLVVFLDCWDGLGRPDGHITAELKEQKRQEAVLLGLPMPEEQPAKFSVWLREDMGISVGLTDPAYTDHSQTHGTAASPIALSGISGDWDWKETGPCYTENTVKISPIMPADNLPPHRLSRKAKPNPDRTTNCRPTPTAKPRLKTPAPKGARLPMATP